MLRLADRSRKARVVGRSPVHGRAALLAGLQVARPRAGRGGCSSTTSRPRGAQGGVREHPRLLVLARLGVGRVRDRRARTTSSDAPSDLYRSRSTDAPRVRITRDRKSLNPLWGAGGIIHDRQRLRTADAPSYNLFEIQPDGGSLRRITALRDPDAGERPGPARAVGRRQAAAGRVRRPGHQRRLRGQPGDRQGARARRDFENGFVAANLSADGTTVLGHTGGPDPTGAQRGDDALPGGKPTVLVRRASFPDWSQ